MPWEYNVAEGIWDTTKMTLEERAYEHQRWKDNVLMWRNEWAEDPRALRLDIKGHPLFYVRLIAHKKNSYARFNTRSSGVTTPECWFVANGQGIAMRMEEAIFTNPPPVGDRVHLHQTDRQGPPHRGDAVVTHYWFEDAPTGMMFKMLWG